MAVEFNEGPVMPVRVADKRVSFITRLVLKAGIAKTPQGAAVVMVIVTIVAALLAYFIFTRTSGEPPAPTPEQIGL